MSIALVFFLLYCASTTFSSAAALPPTLRLAVRADESRTQKVFTHALIAGFALWPQWSIEVGPAPVPMPCTAGRARATLLVQLSAVNGDAQTADVALVDCAAWPVQQWTLSVPQGTFSSQQLATQVLFALRLWEHHEPKRFADLFDDGDAAPRAEACYPELSLVKSTDGRLRAVVRAGGPAYMAGLRSNDVIEQIDGVDWWQYGTYRSQQRALDGQSHTYAVGDEKKEYYVTCTGRNGPVI